MGSPTNTHTNKTFLVEKLSVNILHGPALLWSLSVLLHETEQAKNVKHTHTFAFQKHLHNGFMLLFSTSTNHVLEEEKKQEKKQHTKG